MLFLLLKMSALHSWNYVRDKFDKTTIVYVALIGLMVFYLAGRSSGDIGLRLLALPAQNFSQQWLGLWSGVLPLYYLFSEFSAVLTLRSSALGALLASLPLTHKTINRFVLVKYFVKFIGPFFVLVFPFVLGNAAWPYRATLALSGGAVLLAVQLVAWLQAHRLLRTKSHLRRVLLRWLAPEAIFLALLAVPALWTNDMQQLVAIFSNGFFTIAAVLLCCALYRLAVHTDVLLFSASDRGALWHGSGRVRRIDHPPNSRFFTLFLHDLHFVRKKKKSIFAIQAAGAFLALMISLNSSEASAALAGVVFMQCLWSFFLINVLTDLFKRDAAALALLRSLRLTAMELWRTRFAFAATMLAVPFVPALAIVLLQAGTAASLSGIAVLAMLGIPGLLAMLYTTAGFGTLPHVNFGATMMNLSLLLIVLFWFYLPFGSFFILLVLLYWLRKSHRNLELVEVE